MYNTKLLQARMAARGFNPYQLSLAAKVDRTTVLKVIEEGKGNPAKAYVIARALGFKVKRHDLSEIIAADEATIDKSANRKSA
jgi:hypothetical protein